MKVKVYTRSEVEKIKVDSYNKGVSAGIRKTIKALGAIKALVLLDKWGWSVSDVNKFTAQVDKQFAIINEDYNTLDDVYEVLLDEYGIEVEED